MSIDLKKMERGARLILEGMNVNLEDENFRETPTRVAKLYKEMLTPPENNMTTFSSPSSGMIVLRGHKVFALCPHHLQPVEIRCYVGYIPKDKVLGLSKLARIVESQLTRPMMQEELAELVVEALDAKLNPKGCGVVLAGIHGCMRFRGVMSESDTVTNALRGLFLHAEQVRAEFFNTIGRP